MYMFCWLGKIKK